MKEGFVLLTKDQFTELLKRAMAIRVDEGPLLHDWKLMRNFTGTVRLVAEEYSVYGAFLHEINLSDVDRITFHPLGHVYEVTMKKSGSYDIQLYMLTPLTPEEGK